MRPKEYDLDAMLAENAQRNIEFERKYNPMTGEGSTALPRIRVVLDDYYGEGKPGQLWLPEDMIREEGGIQDLCRAGGFRKFIATRDRIKAEYVMQEQIDNEIVSFCEIRMEYDFEYWAASAVLIKDKVTGQDVPFVLNFPQRNILLPALEKQRRAEEPIRIILLKARQWGGSTMTQLYMLWIQMCLKTGWNSVIAAHKKSGSRTIKGMVNKAVTNYPDFMGKFEFARWENSNSTSIIKGRNCKVTIGTSQVPDSVRSEDIVMAHLSEVAYWQNAEMIKPEDLMASIVGSILRVPYSLVVIESTANGVGNFFHKEWQAAEATAEGRAKEDEQSDKTPVFVPWWKIELYRESLSNKKNTRAMVDDWGEYEWNLWDIGASLEAIKWWRGKRKELRTAGIAKMKAEYPSTAEEAFVSSGRAVFSSGQCKAMRRTCMEPVVKGELGAEGREGKDCLLGLKFHPDEYGNLHIWEKPEAEPLITDRYLVVVDVGGRSERSDWSVICVIDRADKMGGGRDAIVAQWRGHIDHDLLVWKAVQIASWYNNALLVIESNTLETRDTDGDHTQFILEKAADVYSNLYARDDPDKLRMGVPLRYGFHTNKATKTAVIDSEIKMYRECGYIERCSEAVDEHMTYEKGANGSYAAKEGKHDDLLMTRAIGMYISENMDVPVVVQRKNNKNIRKADGSMSSF